MQVQSLVWEDPLEKEMAAHFNILAWRIPWTKEPGELWSMGLRNPTQLSDWHFHFHRMFILFNIINKVAVNIFLTLYTCPIISLRVNPKSENKRSYLFQVLVTCCSTALPSTLNESVCVLIFLVHTIQTVLHPFANEEMGVGDQNPFWDSRASISTEDWGDSD